MLDLVTNCYIILYQYIEFKLDRKIDYFFYEKQI